eukprot:275142-Pyramimonas_sp.AAC.1
MERERILELVSQLEHQHRQVLFSCSSCSGQFRPECRSTALLLRCTALSIRFLRLSCLNAIRINLLLRLYSGQQVRACDADC